MTFELGVIVCWFLFLVWACSSGIARALSMEGYQRSRLIGMPSRLPLLLALSFMLCLSLQPAQALASETESSVDETEYKSELPENFVEVMESRTSGDQYVVIENDKAVLKSVPNAAKSVGADLALDIFKDMVTGEISSNAATQRIMHDLAWRYYAHPDKRDKIPLWKMRDYDPVYGYAVYSLQECSSYGDWCAKNKYYNNYFAGFLTASFQLRELNHQGRSWDSTSPAASELFSEWYYYYEGEPSSDGTVVEGDYTLVSVTAWSNSIPSNKSGVTSIGVLTTQYQELRNYASANGQKIIAYANSDGARLQTLPTGVGVFWDVTARRDSGRYVCVIGANSTDYNGAAQTTGLKAITGSGTVQNGVWYVNGSMSNSNMSFGWLSYGNATGYSRYGQLASNVYYKNESVYGEDSGGGSNEPVPSPGPTPKPQPQQPIITTVNSPTYNNVTYQTINQTDVDLQPIIDALAVHDENMQDAWNAYSILFDDWMDTLKTVIENWEQVWLDWTNTLYQDLQYYLDQIQYVLYEILMALQSEPYVPVPQPETVTINFDNAVNNLSTRFPFSIPWDVKLIMELLEQPRQAPEFDLPVVMTEYTVHIDFSPFENMAAVSRFMSLVLFTGGLLMATKKMIGF